MRECEIERDLEGKRDRGKRVRVDYKTKPIGREKRDREKSSERQVRGQRQRHRK